MVPWSHSLGCSWLGRKSSARLERSKSIAGGSLRKTECTHSCCYHVSMENRCPCVCAAGCDPHLYPLGRSQRLTLLLGCTHLEGPWTAVSLCTNWGDLCQPGLGSTPIGEMPGIDEGHTHVKKHLFTIFRVPARDSLDRSPTTRDPRN